MAAGLHAGDHGRHLISFKPDPAPFTSSFLHNEPWLDFNCMQTWRWTNLIYPFINIDYRLKPVKPVIMAEGAYEAGTEYGFAVSPVWVRRQAYYSYFTGAHHTYGHNDSWRVLPTWKKALHAPGARQMSVLRDIFMKRREWWYLVPDQSMLAGNGRTSGEILVLACRHQDGAWFMVYAAARSSFSVILDKLKAGAGKKMTATWIDPRNGKKALIGKLPRRGVKTFSTPAAWEDAVPVIEP